MKSTRPVVIKIGETRVDREGIKQMLAALGVSQEGSTRFEKAPDTGETLIELAGRICYESFEVGLNPNVTRIRLNPKDYFENLLRKGDGSVAEHAWVSFALIGVSRIMTHELVRHRVGIAVSQESLRYVRPKDIKFWTPDELSPEQSSAMQLAVKQWKITTGAWSRQSRGIQWTWTRRRDSHLRFAGSYRTASPQTSFGAPITGRSAGSSRCGQIRQPKSKSEWCLTRLPRFASATSLVFTRTSFERNWLTAQEPGSLCCAQKFEGRWSQSHRKRTFQNSTFSGFRTPARTVVSTCFRWASAVSNPADIASYDDRRSNVVRSTRIAWPSPTTSSLNLTTSRFPGTRAIRSCSCEER